MKKIKDVVRKMQKCPDTDYVMCARGIMMNRKKKRIFLLQRNEACECVHALVCVCEREREFLKQCVTLCL